MGNEGGSKTALSQLLLNSSQWPESADELLKCVCVCVCTHSVSEGVETH